MERERGGWPVGGRILPREEEAQWQQQWEGMERCAWRAGMVGTDDDQAGIVHIMGYRRQSKIE
jgi:hypothetical protein